MAELRVISLLLVAISLTVKDSYGCPVECTCQNTEVDCRARGLTSIPQDIGSTTTELYLSNNDITSIGSSISHLEVLRVLDLHGNSLSMVDDKSLTNLLELTSLNLGSNEISMLSKVAFSTLTKLQDLNLGNNQLEILPDGLFNNTYQLQKLTLTSNRLTEVSLEVMNTISLALLHELYLSRNLLIHLPYLAFNNLASLQTLFIIQSSTDSIDSNAFVGLNELQVLDLSLNQMSTFRREMFHSLPKISQLGITGNPMLCSCNIKQVQDYLRENTVTLLIAATCSVDASVRDIEHGNLTDLCPDQTTTPPSGTVAPWCGENTSLVLELAEIGKESALFKWDIHNGVLPPGINPHLFVRKATEDSTSEYHIEITTPTETSIFVELDEASPYITCIYQMDCKLRDCVNFATSGYNVSGPLTLGAAVVVTCACFAVIIIILLVALGITWKRRGSNYKTGDAQATSQTANPVKVQLSLNEDPYEDIPPDTLIDKRPKRRHANDALPQPGDNSGLAQRPVTATSQAIVNKKEVSPHKHDKQEQIATSAQTKVFRRPNTMGSQELLSSTPGLPPKSAALSKSQELKATHGYPHPTILPIDFSNSSEKVRISHVYIEPDEPYEND